MARRMARRQHGRNAAYDLAAVAEERGPLGKRLDLRLDQLGVLLRRSGHAVRRGPEVVFRLPCEVTGIRESRPVAFGHA